MGGALAGGGMGAIAGAALPGERQPQEPIPTPEPGPDAQLALPAPDPTLALPSPTGGGTIFGRDERPIPMPGPDGSSAGTVAAPPDQSSLVEGAAATINPMGSLPAPEQVPPHGPMEAIAQGLAGALPAPAPAPAPIFPDQKPGGAVRLGDPASGTIADAVFMGETPEGVAQVRIAGQIIDMSPAEFDMARGAVGEIEAAQKEAERAENQARTKAPDAPGALAQAAMAGVSRPEGMGEQRRLEDEMAAMAPDEARKSLAALESMARSRGWNSRTSNMRQILRARIANGERADDQPGTAPDRIEDANNGPVDGYAGRSEDAAPDGPDQQVGSEAGEGLAQEGLPEGSGREPAVAGPVVDFLTAVLTRSSQQRPWPRWPDGSGQN